MSDNGNEPETRDVARAHRSVESLHSLVYFVPEGAEEYGALGLRGRAGYFTSRSAPMGPVRPEVTTATFYNFHPGLVAKFAADAWTVTTPADVLAARLRVVDRAYRRLLGDDVVAGAEVAEAAELVRVAADGLPVTGRPLFAGHAALDWPGETHLALWHGITLLREYRGDGHIAALTVAGLSGLESLVTHTASGTGFTPPAAKATRGWSDAEWDACVADLSDRGLLDADGLTDAGQDLRRGVEADTDRLGAAPWRTLGPERTARLTEIGRGLSRTVAAAGAFPDGVFARGR